MSKGFLVFDIWGDYAHFKKYYTTSSPLTFSVPPRPVVAGIVGAIVGLEKDQYLGVMTREHADVAVRILNPIHKLRVTLNLIDTKDGYWWPVERINSTGRTQVRFEFIDRPRYRIYFRHRDESLYRRLRDNLSNHLSVYTPYLGISEHIADFRYVGEYGVVDEGVEDTAEIHTVLPVDELLSLCDVGVGYKYFKERMPAEMLPGRVVTEYRELLYEIEGRPIRARVKRLLRLANGDVITLL